MFIFCGGTAEQYLRQHNILLAQHRGVHGVSPWEIDDFESEMRQCYGNNIKLVYDIDLDDLSTLPKKLIQKIAAGRTWLLGDLTEGNIWGNSNIEFLKSLHLETANIFFLSCNLAARESIAGSMPNVIVLPWANSFASITMYSQSNQHLLESKQNHLDRIDQLYNQTAPHSFLSLNGKPRMPRVQFLANAYRRGLLDQALWSLVYYPQIPDRRPDEYISIGHRSYSMQLSDTDQYTDFFAAHSWPKLIGTDILDFKMLLAAPLELMDQANWHVVIETVVTKPNDPLGASNRNTIITEKFYKAVILGQPIIPIGWQGCHRDITSAGYQLPDLNFDHLDSMCWESRLTRSLDLLENLGNKNRHRQQALNNFERLADRDQLVRDVCEPLLQIREVPASKPFAGSTGTSFNSI
jgi:hypothetical protein